MPVLVIIINGNNDDDDDKEEVPRASSAPLSAAAGGAGRQRGRPGGGRGGGCSLPPQNKRERRRWRQRPGRTEGIVPRWCGIRRWVCEGDGAARAKARGQRQGLAEGLARYRGPGGRCVGPGVRRGREQPLHARAVRRGKGGEGVYRPVRGGGSIPGHPTAASSGRCSVRAGTPATRVGSPRVGSRWMRTSRDPATDTSFSSPLSPHPQVSRDSLRGAAMSRRSQRLVTTRCYPGDDDATTSSSSTSLLGGTQLPFKETTGR